MTSQELQQQIFDLIKQKGSVSTLGIACYFAEYSDMDVSLAVHHLKENGKIEQSERDRIIFFTIKNNDNEAVKT